MYRLIATQLQLLWLELRAALAFRAWEAAHNRALYYKDAAHFSEIAANEARREYQVHARRAQVCTMMHGRAR